MSIWRAYADPSILARLEQLPQYRQATKEADEYWCKCVKRNLRDVIYCDDGNKINSDRCSKHHWHCAAWQAL